MLFSILTVLLIMTAASILAYQRASLAVWSVSALSMLILLTALSSLSLFSLILLWVVVISVFAVLGITPLRRYLIVKPIFALLKKEFPSMSITEREALGAGTIGWEAQLFAGSPQWPMLLTQPYTVLSGEEKAFLEGPVNQLCRMLDEWQTTHEKLDLSQEVWQFIKENKFFGLIIPKEYGGLDFSATAQVAVLSKIYGKSSTAATTIGVPNSLGPAELLVKYGTDEQKNYYLPRLAKGEEVPCFALTNPLAGSDAASIPDRGIVCRVKEGDKTVIRIRLNWNKRYITLAPVATVVGLAFRLFDPEHILGSNEDLGITCALIPRDTAGVTIGRRHLPIGTAFLNGPTQGKDVMIPVDWIIGGQAMAGQGWRMLMECLAVGRAITLPSSALGGVEAATLSCAAYGRVRKQFNSPIAYFEGIEEPLTRIAANTYIIQSTLRLITSAIDQGEEPALASAIVKYHTTERCRQVALDAMDIHGGKGICQGPRNYIALGYQGAPIAITVEGANILTRNLIIFGQGALRCHPYLASELKAIEQGNLDDFDKLLGSHVKYAAGNKIRAFTFALTDGRWSDVPDKSSPVKHYFQLVNRYSAALAYIADMSFMIIGGKLKRKESLSARLGDILSALYLVSAILKRFIEDGKPASDQALVSYTCDELFMHVEQCMVDIIRNFPNRFVAWAMRMVVLPFGQTRHRPPLNLYHRIARLLLERTETLDRLTVDVFRESLANNPLGRLEQAMIKIIATTELEKKVQAAAREGLIKGLTLMELIDKAEAQGILDPAEVMQLREAEQARLDVIAVDDFEFTPFTPPIVKMATERGEAMDLQG